MAVVGVDAVARIGAATVRAGRTTRAAAATLAAFPDRAPAWTVIN
jgi:hypothetical protein